MLNGSINLTPLFQALITVLGLIITTFLVPWIKSKTTNEQQEKLRAYVQIGVYAAEKMYGAGHGDKKLEYVKKMLEDHGFTINFRDLQDLINAELADMELINTGFVKAIKQADV